MVRRVPLCEPTRGRENRASTLDQPYGIPARYPKSSYASHSPVRAIVQRVSQARVEVDGVVTGAIEGGLLVLLGAARTDSPADADYLADKIVQLRIFSDEDGKMNRSLLDTGGALLVVSQFTLYGDTRKGRRPSFDQAAPPDEARALYEHFVAAVRRLCPRVETGVFQAHMQVSLVNDGPVTLIVESPPSSASSSS